MTDEELKALVAENSLAIRELRASQAESAKRWAESEKRWQESRQEWRESREESEKRWQESRQESQESREESEKRWQESRQESQESRQEWRELREESEKRWQESREEILASRREMDRVITSFNRDLGRLGNALGDYTEALFRPSLDRAMREQFKMTVVLSPLRIRRGGETLQIDLVAHAGDEIDEIYVVEIKSQLRAADFDQLHEHMRRYPHFFPEHRGKRFFGVLAAVDIPEDLAARAKNEGIYLATIKDDVFEIVPPGDFEPRAFGLRGLS